MSSFTTNGIPEVDFLICSHSCGPDIPLFSHFPFMVAQPCLFFIFLFCSA